MTVCSRRDRYGPAREDRSISSFSPHDGATAPEPALAGAPGPAARPAPAPGVPLGAVQDFHSDSAGLAIRTEEGRIRVSFPFPDVARVRIERNGGEEPDRSFAVLPADRSAAPFTVRETDEAIEAGAGAVTVAVRKADGAVSVASESGLEVLSGASVVWAGEGFRLSWAMPADRRVCGIGEQAGSLERRGHRMELWNTDHYMFKVDATPLYQSIPFCLTMDGGEAAGMLLDNTFRQSWDLSAVGETRAVIEADGGAVDLYLIASGTPKAVLSRYTELTGRMPLPPLWALGFQQSRYSYYPEAEVRRVAAEFRARGIPCDVLYLDIHYMDAYKCFTWDSLRFPDPRRMLADLREMGFRVITIIDPGVKVEPGYGVYEELRAAGFYLKNPDGSPFVGPVWPGDCLFPDFSDPRCREWWGGLYGRLLDDGVAAFWNDMNEPAVFETPSQTAPLESLQDGDGFPGTHARYHNVYGMQMAQATFEGLRRLRPEERPFVVSRAAYAGSHRYTAAWTGDNVASWDHLRITLPMVMNLGLSGQAISGPDIGGFVGDPTPELFARWLQFGALLPFARVHSARASHDQIHAEGAAEQEPWSHGPEWEAINRASIARRYQLLPYLYTVVEEMTRTGWPVMRPLSFEYPDDPACLDRDDQFLLGRDLLVAPVVEEGQARRRVYLPAGAWYDYETGEFFSGPAEVEVDAPLDRLPIFARAGSAIPMLEGEQNTSEAQRLPIRWRAFPGPDGTAEGELYEDDGNSMAYGSGEFRRTRIRITRFDGRTDSETSTEGAFQSRRPEAMVEVTGEASATG